MKEIAEKEARLKRMQDEADQEAWDAGRLPPPIFTMADLEDFERLEV